MVSDRVCDRPFNPDIQYFWHLLTLEMYITLLLVTHLEVMESVLLLSLCLMPKVVHAVWVMGHDIQVMGKGVFL